MAAVVGETECDAAGHHGVALAFRWAFCRWSGTQASLASLSVPLTFLVYSRLFGGLGFGWSAHLLGNRLQGAAFSFFEETVASCNFRNFSVLVECFLSSDAWWSEVVQIVKSNKKSALPLWPSHVICVESPRNLRLWTLLRSSCRMPLTILQRQQRKAQRWRPGMIAKLWFFVWMIIFFTLRGIYIYIQVNFYPTIANYDHWRNVDAPW